MNVLVANLMVDNYFKFLNNLDINSKQALIAKLSNSLDSKTKTKALDFSSCFGEWEDSRTAEEIVFDLRKDRVNQLECEEF